MQNRVMMAGARPGATTRMLRLGAGGGFPSARSAGKSQNEREDHEGQHTDEHPSPGEMLGDESGDYGREKAG